MRSLLWRWLCGERNVDQIPPAAKKEIPQELKDASHRLAAAAQKIQSAAHVFSREHDAFDALVHTMQGEDKE